MSADYLIVIGDDAEAADLDPVLTRPLDLRPVHVGDRVRVLTRPHAALSGFEGGIVLGTAFRAGETTPLRTLTGAMIDHAVATGGASLLHEVWGGYLAVTTSTATASISVMRDPSGALPAYVARHGRSWWIFSRLDIALRAGLDRPQLDWPAIGRLLTYPQVRGSRTGLRGVDEILPGVCSTFGVGGQRKETLAWSPWTFAAGSAQIDDPQKAVAAVREAVVQSVRGWSAVSGSCVLELSGGLDSSIIACSLAPTSAATLVNFHTPTLDGDERRYAQAVAAAIGGELTTKLVRPDAVDIRRTRPGAHPRPAGQALLQPIDDALARLGGERRAGAYLSGLGGDNVFCALPSAAPAADALRRFGPGRRFFTALDELCRRHDATAWRALTLTLRKALRPQPMLGLAPVFSFVSAQAPEDPPEHPWFEPPQGVLPGKREHVAAILVAMGFLDRYAHADLVPVRFPLLAQPVLEACLRVPTWMANAGGRNRAVARDAFRDKLPPEVFQRQSKGGLTGFMGQAFAANRAALVAQLERGWLANAELLDRHEIRATLAKPAPDALEMARLLYLADVEAWARTWPITGAAGAQA